jgi:hypothetical protein
LAVLVLGAAIVAAAFGFSRAEAPATSPGGRGTAGDRCATLNKGVPRFSGFAEAAVPSARPGERLTIVGRGHYAPARRVELRLRPRAAAIATAMVDAGCSFRAAFEVPDVWPGRHRVIVTLVDPRSSFRLESEHAFDVVESPRKLVAAPAWVMRYCMSAARAMRRAVLCPGALPEPLEPTENLRILRPSRRGYIFEGEGLRHWVFGVFAHPEELQDFGPPRSLGKTRVRGRATRWLYAPAHGGILAGHLVLAWEESGLAYAVTVHTARPTSRALREELRRVATSLRAYAP